MVCLNGNRFAKDAVGETFTCPSGGKSFSIWAYLISVSLMDLEAYATGFRSSIPYGTVPPSLSCEVVVGCSWKCVRLQVWCLAWGWSENHHQGSLGKTGNWVVTSSSTDPCLTSAIFAKRLLPGWLVGLIDSAPALWPSRLAGWRLFSLKTGCWQQ